MSEEIKTKFTIESNHTIYSPHGHTGGGAWGCHKCGKVVFPLYINFEGMYCSECKPKTTDTLPSAIAEHFPNLEV